MIAASFDRVYNNYIKISNRKGEHIMSEKELERKNPCGDDKEIDEYLDGTICELKDDETAIHDIKAPAGEKFDVHSPDEPDTIKDEYIGSK